MLLGDGSHKTFWPLHQSKCRLQNNIFQCIHFLQKLPLICVVVLSVRSVLRLSSTHSIRTKCELLQQTHHTRRPWSVGLCKGHCTRAREQNYRGLSCKTLRCMLRNHCMIINLFITKGQESIAFLYSNNVKTKQIILMGR